MLTLRIPLDLDRRIAHHARKTKRSKSVVLGEALQSAFGGGQPPGDPSREARRQSLLV